jgi:hypothetical protein
VDRKDVFGDLRGDGVAGNQILKELPIHPCGEALDLCLVTLSLGSRSAKPAKATAKYLPQRM